MVFRIARFGFENNYVCMYICMYVCMYVGCVGVVGCGRATFRVCYVYLEILQSDEVLDDRKQCRVHYDTDRLQY